MWGPSNGIDTCLVPLQLHDRESREANIEHNNLGAVHDNGGHIPRVLLIPAESDQGRVGLGALVDNGGMLFVAEVENPNRAVGGDRGENANAAPSDVVNLLVVGDELGVDSLSLDVPDGAGGVDAGGADALGLGLVPVEGGERAAELAVLIAVEEALEVDGVVGDAPDAEEVAGGSEEVGLLAVLVGDEDGFGRGIRMLEGEVRVGANLAVGVVELDDFHAVRVRLQEAGDGEAVLLVSPDAPVHGVDVPRSFVSVDL